MFFEKSARIAYFELRERGITRDDFIKEPEFQLQMTGVLNGQKEFFKYDVHEMEQVKKAIIEEIINLYEES